MSFTKRGRAAGSGYSGMPHRSDVRRPGRGAKKVIFYFVLLVSCLIFVHILEPIRTQIL